MITSILFFIVLVGIVLLCVGGYLTLEIYLRTKKRAWLWPLLLISQFFAGYLGFLYLLLSSPINLPVALLETVILLGGSVFVMCVANQSLSSIKELQSLAEREEHNTIHDALTGLPNRHFFFEHIQNHINDGTAFTIVLFDVVNFKQVNDGMGSLYGDQLLVHIGKRIANSVDAHEVVARMGGDEFVIITPKVAASEIKALVERINQKITMPFMVDNFEVVISGVFGTSSFPVDAIVNESLINFADMAMYRAKKSGKLLESYDKKMSEGAKYKLEVSSQIQTALEQGEFELYYQPMVATRTGKVSGFEALIRWQKADGTFVSPADFIPIAEKGNKIQWITKWVLSQVVQDISVFEQHGIKQAVHINLSAKDLLGNQLFNQLSTLVRRDPSITQKLILEITETTAVNLISNPALLLQRIKSLGFKISLDDFGTGYSSLSLLRDFPVEQIKIDRSFVTSLATSEANRSIIHNAVQLAHGLGYCVVAEGVEDELTLAFLSEKQCDYTQGFFHSRALPLSKAIEWTNSFNQKGEKASKDNKVLPIRPAKN